jgi:petrobactin synthase
MTRDEIMATVHTVLKDRMGHPHLAGFALDARLNEDLCLDSVLMLQLFLDLELEYGLSVPEEVIRRQDLATVADLVALFEPAAETVETAAEAPQPASEGVHGEEYVDIKVHCFVSCVCDTLKRAGIDHRPFYFGVWDADFAIADGRLLYHTLEISQEFFRQWYEQLYGVRVREWYDPAKTREENLAVMLGLLEAKRPAERLMVMLDMFHLPERENKFNQNPFPHYLMLEKAERPDVWCVLDPDFRWEGEIERDKVIHAILQPTVGGGYIFDGSEARPAADIDIRDYFNTCFRPFSNPLIDSVRQIMAAHLEGRDGTLLADLALAVRELPVITIRKYAYEHGFAFFWRALKLPSEEFDFWCDEIEALVQELKALHYDCMKLGQTGDRDFAPAVVERLDTADDQERKIKRKLGEVFRLWCRARGLEEVRTAMAGGVR